MNNSDAIPTSLPEIGVEDTFCFDCNPEVPCFNRCCADLNLPLTPYDVLRLRQQLGIESDELLGTFASLRFCEETGFPLPALRMIASPDAPCPFVTPAGCSVYEDRPAACRSYPLGRGAKLSQNGINERFFLVREDHCRGFDKGTKRTPGKWFENQELAKYNHFSDRYMRLMSMVAATKRPISAKMGSMAVLALYQLDKFRGFIHKMGIFSRLDAPAGTDEKIMDNSLAGDEACLEFGLDWVELAIFGQTENLRPVTGKK